MTAYPFAGWCLDEGSRTLASPSGEDVRLTGW
jgi:hypothetical protein